MNMKTLIIMSILKVICYTFIKSITPTTKVYFKKNEGSYYSHDNEINIQLDFRKEDVANFTEHLYTQHKCKVAYKIHPYIWKMLHEIGHFYTIEYCEEDPWALFIIEIENTNCKTKEEKKEIDFVYYNMPVEYAATDWAANFVKNNKKKIIFYNKIFNFINKI